MRTVIVGLFATAALLFVTVGSAQQAGPLMPTNLRSIGATETTVTLAWTGPPGNFSINGETKNSVTVGWSPAVDGAEAVTSYTVWKDGNIVGIANTNQFTFGGMPKGKAKTFRICVQGITISSLKSPQACGTITKL